MAILLFARAMPVNGSGISEKQNETINSAICGVKLTAKERWQHVADFIRNHRYAAVFKEKFSRILTPDGLAKIYDLTKNKIVGIGKCAEHKGRLYLDGRAVNTPDNCTIMFDREHHTDFIVVTDENDSECEIFEHETARGNAAPLRNFFEVDRRKFELFIQTRKCDEGCKHTSIEPVHFIKEIPKHLELAWAKAAQPEGKE